MKRKGEKIESFIPGNDVVFLRKGSAFFHHLKEMINSAEREIHLQTYIWQDDDIGKEINEAVLAAASRGVEIFIMLDAYGSSSLRRNKAWQDQWDKAGIQYRFFGKLFTGRNLNIGRRMHHKIAVVDGRQTMVTGRNIADRYNDFDGKDGWLDFAVKVTGPVGVHLRKVAISFWPERLKGRIIDHPAWLDLTPSGAIAVKIAQNDWFRGIYEMNYSYRSAFSSARKEVVIVGAYFLPGRKIRRSLQRAVQKGARVRVIFSQHSDVPMANYATQYLYAWLLRNKVEIYEWTKSVVHGKVAVVDKYWLTVGSFNLNHLSALESIELNYIFKHRPVAAEALQELNQIINEECEYITPEKFSKSHTLGKKLREWFAYRLYRVSLRILLLFGASWKYAPQRKKAIEG